MYYSSIIFLVPLQGQSLKVRLNYSRLNWKFLLFNIGIDIMDETRLRFRSEDYYEI